MNPKEMLETLHDQWEKEWKKEKADRVATIHNAVIETLAQHRAHIDEVVTALEIALRESIDEKMKQIRSESQIAVEIAPK